ncbi:RNA polymerase sigma factor [Motiliproteus sp.]|uniref:RNA polymerase sigma factor n=1 Tax=Motiliproteus sp. TaxID=1898955 RepID=UPI003BACC384
MTIAAQQLKIQTLMGCSDAELVTRILQGETNAYEGIMRRYNQRLFRVARGIVNSDAEAMDAIQEAYIKAFEQLERLQSIPALPGWLSRIARNEALQLLRRNQRNVAMAPEELESVVKLTAMTKNYNGPDSEVANKQLGQLLESNINQLPDSFRSVFILRAIEQCSVRETAEILDLEEGTVKTRLFRANALLQKQLSLHLSESGVALYEFAGHRCDAVVRGVLARLLRQRRGGD